MNVSEMVKETIDKHPPLGLIFGHPDIYESFSFQGQQSTSDRLVKNTLYVFEMNETEVEIAFVPGKGWGCGFVLPAPIFDSEFEATVVEGPFYEFLGRGLLALLHSMVMHAGYKPIVMSRPHYLKRKEIARQQRRKGAIANG